MNSTFAKIMAQRAVIMVKSRPAFRSLSQPLLLGSRSSLLGGHSKLSVTGSSHFASCSKDKANPALAKFQAMQRHMQKDDGKPVWQKMPNDYKLYQLTWVLVILGLFMDFSLYFSYII